MMCSNKEAKGWMYNSRSVIHWAISMIMQCIWGVGTSSFIVSLSWHWLNMMGKNFTREILEKHFIGSRDLIGSGWSYLSKFHPRRVEFEGWSYLPKYHPWLLDEAINNKFSNETWLGFLFQHQQPVTVKIFVIQKSIHINRWKCLLLKVNILTTYYASIIGIIVSTVSSYN